MSAVSHPIRVLIVDDSALVRRMLREILGNDPAIEVVGHAADPYIARDKIKKLNPDVLTLDVEMPRMDGISFLRNLMRLRPMPVVMVSSLTTKGAEVTLEALELGAIDYVAKPNVEIADTLSDYAEEIVYKVKVAAQARVRSRETRGDRGTYQPGTESAKGPTAFPATAGAERMIVVGASTGGTEALRELLAGMPAGAPPILMVQHIPKLFAGPFAERLDRNSAMTVKLAASGEQIRPGIAYLAPGGEHLTVVRKQSKLVCQLSETVKVNQHRPSVDVLFESAAKVVGKQAIGVLLTGMGADGAQGMQWLKRAGAHTVAQNEQTSVVWGMPREAIELGAVDKVLGLESIGGHLINLLASAANKADDTRLESPPAKLESSK